MDSPPSQEVGEYWMLFTLPQPNTSDSENEHNNTGIIVSEGIVVKLTFSHQSN